MYILRVVFPANVFVVALATLLSIRFGTSLDTSNLLVAALAHSLHHAYYFASNDK
ncbi:hypothetical protein BV25DRAFT_1812305 [Artomyces pyxidatus]|uniref:Uncharacterized protein n=1 Tax=Artomyces pyxidatus TaxID=48021 RepID=A0ACB8SN21_9AGAM|nr:hypothetical protein BV25DRAFT_1812305 [Artomyces pyxidatus]